MGEEVKRGAGRERDRESDRRFRVEEGLIFTQQVVLPISACAC